MTITRPCVYVTDGWGIHDERWVNALTTIEYSPQVLRLGLDMHSLEQLQEHLEQSVTSGTPILAGPLDSVTRYLTGFGLPVIGLSWGFDLLEMLDTAWLPELTGLIVDSPATQQKAIDAGVDSDRITMLPWGVDLSVFTPEGPTLDLEYWHVPADACVLLSLRAHEPRYHIADIISACADLMAHHQRAFLLIGHSGSLTPALKQLVEDYEISDRVRFIGTMDEDAIPALMRAVDVYVSASVVDGSSVTLLQAMACGTPVVVSDIPGNSYWMAGETAGWTFTAGSPASLSAQLTSMLGPDRDALQLRSAAALSRVHDLADWRANLKGLEKALDRVVNLYG